MASATFPGVTVNTSLNPLQSSTPGVPTEATPVFALGYNRGPVQPTSISSWQQYVNLYGGFSVANGSYLAYAVYQFFQNGGSSCYVLRVPNQDAVTATLSLDGVGGDSATPILTVSAQSPGMWGNSIYITVTSAGQTGRVSLTIYSGGSSSSNIVEQFVDMSMNPADPRYLVSMVNSPLSGSQNIVVSPLTAATPYVLGTTDLAIVSSPTPLASGSDGSIAPTLGTAIPAGLNSLQGQVLNLNVPGWTTTSDLNSILENMPQQTTFLVADAPFGGLPLETSAQVAANAIGMVQGSSIIAASVNAALYTPWMNIANPGSAVPGATVWVPPGGAVLGNYQANDTVYGVQKAPAGINATVAAVQLEATFNSTDLGNLQTAQVNPIRIIPGVGFCIFGARTLQPGFPNQYVNVERTIQSFIHDMTALTQFALFEPNNNTLWTQIEAVLTNYFTQQMQAGVLAGTTPATAFSVICDSTNNTIASAQAGLLNVNVAVALNSPAEFITINLSQYQGQTTATVTSS